MSSFFLIINIKFSAMKLKGVMPMLEEINEEDMDAIFGPVIEYEQPMPPPNEDAKYRRIHMINWMANGGLCECGKPIDFELFYQIGNCLQCFEDECAGNIEYPIE